MGNELYKVSKLKKIMAKPESKETKRRKRNIFLNFRYIVSTQFGIDKEQVALTSNLSTNLGANSSALIQLSEALEEFYDIYIPQKKIYLISNVEEAINLIYGLLPQEKDSFQKNGSTKIPS